MCKQKTLLMLNWIVWKQIWHEITIKGWYAIKSKNLIKPLKIISVK